MTKSKVGVQATSQIYAVLTDRGAELEAAALATGVPVTLSQFCIGDANGQEEVTPDPARTALIHEVYRGNISASTNLDNQVTFTLEVPTATGGYTIREVGILTDKGELYSVARSPDILKPTESNGALISITYKYTLAVSSSSTITVIVYNDYLTPDAADKKYLQITKNLSEIKDNGENAQKAARENIGITGEKFDASDIAFLSKVNDFNEQNRFKKPISVYDKILLLDALGNLAGYISGADNGASTSTGNDRYWLQFEHRNPGVTGDYGYLFVGSHADALKLLVGESYYTVWNTGNLTPVKSVNNKKPDSNGNVAITVSSSGVQDIRLGTQVTIEKEGDHDQLYACPAGCVVTAIDVDDGGGAEAAVRTVSYKPIQKLISNQWVDILG